jgi:hypothetical protein
MSIHSVKRWSWETSKKREQASRSNQLTQFTWDKTKTENTRHNQVMKKGRTSDRFESVGAVEVAVSNALSRLLLTSETPSKKLSRSNQRFRFTWDRTKKKNISYKQPTQKVEQLTVLKVSELSRLLGFENWDLLSLAQPHE